VVKYLKYLKAFLMSWQKHALGFPESHLLRHRTDEANKGIRAGRG
jgi:hypothetical protein